MDFHLAALLLCNVNLYCFYLIRTLLYLLLKDTSWLSVLLFFHIFEVKELCGVKRHCWCRAGPVLCCGGEGATLSLVGHPSSDSIMIKMPYAVDVLN